MHDAHIGLALSAGAGPCDIVLVEKPATSELRKASSYYLKGVRQIGPFRQVTQLA
jgi:hypothetical protein